ncbi:MAG: TnpV protein [Lachnospiraceae bacterium]
MLRLMVRCIRILILEKADCKDWESSARLEYLHEKHFAYYRELLITNKLAEHCEQYDTKGYELFEKLQQQYIDKHPLPDDDFMETVRIRTQARNWAEEVVLQVNTIY